jgi:hypothetical protein
MIRSILLVSFVIVAACANYKEVHTAGYPGCVWEHTACSSSHACCSNWCVNGYCERRDD